VADPIDPVTEAVERRLDLGDRLGMVELGELLLGKAQAATIVAQV